MVSSGALWLVSLSVSNAEERADGVAPVRGQGSDFMAVGNGTAIWSITWKTTDWLTKDTLPWGLPTAETDLLLTELSGSFSDEAS